MKDVIEYQFKIKRDEYKLHHADSTQSNKDEGESNKFRLFYKLKKNFGKQLMSSS